MNNYVKILINIDNQNVKIFNKNSIYYNRTKYVDIIYYYVKNEIKKSRIEFKYIIIDNMLINDFIKSLFSIKYQRFIKMFDII